MKQINQTALADRIIELVEDMGVEEFAEAIWAKTDEHCDGVAEYSISQDKLLFTREQHGWTQFQDDPDRIEVERFAAYNFEHDGFEITDLFSDVEIAHMNRYYGGDWEKFLNGKKNCTSNGMDCEFSGKTLSERCASAAAWYYNENWEETRKQIMNVCGAFGKEICHENKI